MTDQPGSRQAKPRRVTAWQKFADYVRRVSRGERHVPPWWMRDVGRGDFYEVGEEFVSLFVDLAELGPSETVLEIGCGCGRIALPLARYLDRHGTYVGMDIVKPWIEWSREHISRKYSNFDFFHADLFNKFYNPHGAQRAKDYRFPLGDASFDFVFLTSVFTHMLPEDMVNYLGEIRRLLRSQGRAFMTFFLLNEAQRRFNEEGRGDVWFLDSDEPYRIKDAAVSEEAVGYEETFVRRVIVEAGMQIREPIRYGKWTGREDGLSYQDIVIAAPAGP